MMMKAEEFRIGNFLNYDTSEGHELTVLDWQDIRMASVENGYFNQYYSPIPLTEEWFWKFGVYEYPNKALGGIVRVSGGVCFFKHNELDIEIKYVHTFQNFIFALTGQELTIKEL
jgi:hypothetical protein